MGTNGWRLLSASNSARASRTALASLVETPKLRLLIVSDVGEIEREQVQRVVDDQELAVVADEVVAGARRPSTPASSIRCSSLRRRLSPPRLVWATSTRTWTPRCTAAPSAFSISSRSIRKMAMSTLRFAR